MSYTALPFWGAQGEKVVTGIYPSDTQFPLPILFPVEPNTAYHLYPSDTVFPSTTLYPAG